MNYQIAVSDAHWPYLVAQCGQLYHLKGDRVSWHAAYEHDLRTIYENIQEHLPLSVRHLRVLDVGSGLGGIDVLIDRNQRRDYGYTTEVCLLDGLKDPPTTARHNQTFNDMKVAEDFLHLNGVGNVSWLDPKRPTPRPFDLIVSFRSWCFHYPPSWYLALVEKCCHPGTVLILDVRAQRSEWLADLFRAFDGGDVIHMTAKSNRRVFRYEV
jgi:SAM-dependent methyltransferase